MVYTQDQPGLTDNILRGIQLGVSVFDANHVRMGNVIAVYDPLDKDNTRRKHPALLPVWDNVPNAVVQRLHQEGYLEVETGLFSGNYFVLPRQIADITEAGVFLLYPQKGFFKF